MCPVSRRNRQQKERQEEQLSPPHRRRRSLRAHRAHATGVSWQRASCGHVSVQGGVVLAVFVAARETGTGVSEASHLIGQQPLSVNLPPSSRPDACDPCVSGCERWRRWRSQWQQSDSVVGRAGSVLARGGGSFLALRKWRVLYRRSAWIGLGDAGVTRGNRHVCIEFLRTVTPQ